MSDLITKKIEELTALAEIEGEPNVQIVMLGLSASRSIQDDGLLAGKVQEFIRDVLMPRCIEARNQQIAIQN